MFAGAISAMVESLGDYYAGAAELQSSFAILCQSKMGAIAAMVEGLGYGNDAQCSVSVSAAHVPSKSSCAYNSMSCPLCV